MTKRQILLEHIRIEVAQNDKVTQRATRLYVENRISYKVFMEAAQRGMKQYDAQAGRNGVKCESQLM